MLFPSGSWEWYEEEKDSFAFFDNKPTLGQAISLLFPLHFLNIDMHHFRCLMMFYCSSLCTQVFYIISTQFQKLEKLLQDT